MKTSFIVAVLCMACPPASGGDSACGAKDFSGVYGFHASSTNVTNNVPATFAGSLTADGEGNITAWMDWVATAATPPVPPNFKLVPPVRDLHEAARIIGNQIRYSVEPDCRITISTAVPGPTGVVTPIVWLGALVSGGDEALLMNGSPQSPQVSLVTVKRASRKLAGAEQK